MNEDELNHRRFNQFLALIVGVAAYVAATMLGMRGDIGGFALCCLVGSAMQFALLKGFF